MIQKISLMLYIVLDFDIKVSEKENEKIFSLIACLLKDVEWFVRLNRINNLAEI